METKNNQWRVKSFSFWCVLMIALGILFIGIRFIIEPEIGAAGYGIPFSKVDDTVYGQIKGIRDVASGLILLPMLFLRMRKAIAWVFSIASIIPTGDFLIILFHKGVSDLSHLLIHGITAAVMMLTGMLLFYGLSNKR
ncbi:DUF4267 domain-containing protein [Sphingobacterium sp. lm-10]|uniref:DUF4267 domain-containing protein n=1 Tax=Sphingobacterium sp. lm-10 TaxID=2944904 RepID=UPI00202267BC|nr:DUF4267 domain-containing protein [Sphingobacterium sp. lm-10]MCL7987299.1 DUF4267 domain-containing protein [Sphingobacterium sp. lm-10]